MTYLDNEFSSHINTIINAKRNKMLAIFIGAGISKTADTPSNKIPDWSELINKIKNELNEKKEQDYLKIAQLYYLTFGEHKYHNMIKRYFPDTIEPSIIHEMIFNLNPQIIITTNWDSILENSIRKQGYLYDVICSDAELVRSTLPKKIIKMHGDFNHHNFVFKEDDYINYSELFPLTENFIKGILTTHTVLFLGYSYNDINIKHIIKWIQNRSTCRPPMFITVFNSNQSQKRYFENYGITTLVLKEESTTLSNAHKKYTKKIHWFLNILNTNDYKYNLSTNEDIVNFIYNKIIILNDLQNILLSHIESILSNCNIKFSRGFPDLMFIKDYLYNDINDKEIRVIYYKFIDMIKTIDEKNIHAILEKNGKLKIIFEIFYRAGIKGIWLTDDLADKIEIFDLAACFPIDKSDFIENIINFNFYGTSSDSTDSITDKMNRSFIFYQREQYENIIPLLEEIISDCRTQKKWTLLFIAMLNKNIVIRQLKFFNPLRKNYSFKEYDLNEEYEKLPEEIKTVVKPIFDFLEFNDLYKLFFSLSKDLVMKKGHIETKKSGGKVFGTDGGKNSMQQVNLLRFVIGNKIMIENYIEYRDIHKTILSIRFTEQELNETITMNRIELYTAIKYYDKKSLQDLLKDCYPRNENDNHKKLVISDENKKWLVDNVFVNLSEQYLNSKDVFSSIEKYLLNSVFLLSLINFEKSIIDFILCKVNDIIAHHNNSINLYEGIDLFLGLQYNLFSSDIDPKHFTQILESVIGKIIKREWNFHERSSFTGTGLRNIFGYAKVQQAVFNNEKIVKQLILEISNFSTKEKMEIVSSILLNIYIIGTDNIKQLIKDFVLNIDNPIDVDNKPFDTITSEDDLQKLSEKQINIGSRIIFEINLDLTGLKQIDHIVIENIEKYLNKYENSSYYDSYAVTICNLIISIYEKEKNENMKNLYIKAKKFIENKNLFF